LSAVNKTLFFQKKILFVANKILFATNESFSPKTTFKEVAMAVAPKHVRVLLPHNSLPDHDVEEVGGSVLNNLYTTAKNNFSTPPVDQPTLQTALTDFTTAIAATVQGGPHATNQKNKKKHELVALLRKLGLYVQGACNEDVAILTSSGFQAASPVRVKGPLPKAVIATVENGHTTQLLVTMDKMAKAKAFELYIANMRLTKEQLAALCREYGPRLHVPAGVDGAQMMLSRAGIKTTIRVGKKKVA
jgi:hypothetical protein